MLYPSPALPNRAMKLREARPPQIMVDRRAMIYRAFDGDYGLRMGALTPAQAARAGQPGRAALGTGKLTRGLPAQRFSLKCAEFGLDVGDPAAFVTSYRAQLFGILP